MRHILGMLQHNLLFQLLKNLYESDHNKSLFLLHLSEHLLYQLPLHMQSAILIYLEQ